MMLRPGLSALALLALSCPSYADPVWTVTPPFAPVAPYSILSNNTGSASGPTSNQSLILGAPGFSTTGNGVFGQLTGSINSTYEFIIQNSTSGTSASTDFVPTADDGTDTTHYADFGINSSGGGAAPFTNAHAAYVYSIDAELDIGALGTSGVNNFYCGGGTTPTLCGKLNGTGLALPQTGVGALNIGAATSGLAQLTLSTNTATTLPNVASVTDTVKIAAADTTRATMELNSWGNQNIVQFSFANGTAASPSATTATTMASILFGGYDGSTYQPNGAIFRASAAETWSGTARGTTLHFFIVPVTTTSLLDLMNVDGVTSAVALGGATGAESLRAVNVASAVDRIEARGSATGSPATVQLTAAGTDSNINFKVSPLGTGVVQFGNASSFSANASVATVLGSLGPTGSHTTVQEWLTVQDSAGTVRYIPAF